MFNTPNGIADRRRREDRHGWRKLEIVAPRVRGGYFARRTREIYYSNATGGA